MVKLNGEIMFHYANDISPIVYDEDIAVCNCGFFIGERAPYTHKRKEVHGMVLYIHEGVATVTINNEKHVLNAGSVIIFPPNSYHNIFYHDNDINARYYIYFNGTKVKEILEDLKITETVYKVGNFLEFIDTYKLMIKDFKKNGFTNMTYKKILFLNLFARIHAKYYYPNLKSANNKISTAINHMHDNFMYKILSIDEYATMCNMSKVTFVKYFKLYKNTTPTKYFNALKISNAQLQLLNTDKTISEIAYDLNFDDPLYFSKMFRKITGESPSDFRKKRF